MSVSSSSNHGAISGSNQVQQSAQNSSNASELSKPSLELVLKLLHKGDNKGAAAQLKAFQKKNTFIWNKERRNKIIDRALKLKVRNKSGRESRKARRLFFKWNKTYGFHRELHQRLADAIDSGDVKKVYSLAWSGADVNFGTETLARPLRLAIAKNSPEILQVLLRRGAKVRTASSDWEPPLYLASSYGNVDVVKQLVEAGAEIDEKTQGYAGYNANSTALTIASQKGHADVVAYLLSKGANANTVVRNQRDAQTSPLQLAVANGSADVVKQLIKSGANVTGGGEPLLLLAARNGHDGVAALLLQTGVNVHMNDDQGLSALFYAVERGDHKMAELLIKHGANIYTIRYGQSLSELAAKKKDQKMVELLAPKNADIDSKSKALFDAVEQDDLEKVKQLIKDGADVNVVTDYGESALIAALGDKKAEIAKVLIAAGADVFCEDELGKTAMELAIAMGDVEIFQALVKKGIKVIPKHLAYAIEDGQVQLIKPMYQLSPMIRWSVEHGPYLRLAAEKGNSLCALYLLFLGAKLDARGARQKTAEQIARESGNTHLANLLKTYPQKVQTLKNKILKKVFFDDIEVPRNYPKLLLQWCGN